MEKTEDKFKFLDLGGKSSKKATLAKDTLVTHYLLILDKSGSMQSVRDVTLSGFNENIQTIKSLVKKYPNQKFYVSLVAFNVEPEVVIWKKDADKIEELTAKSYIPEGVTALFDAVGYGVNRLREEIIDDLKNPEVKVVVSIFTDGEENASKKYFGKDISDLLEEIQKMKQWTCSYIGANHDVKHMASSLNIPLSNTISYYSDKIGTTKAFKAASMGTMNYASGRSLGEDVSDKMYSATADTLDIKDDFFDVNSIDKTKKNKEKK
jgi:hypothetical protein